jgi:NAD-dependent deacetylase
MSTEWGIPDFRSPAGIWARYDPLEYASIDAFLAEPMKVWDFYATRLKVFAERRPNDGHRALASRGPRLGPHLELPRLRALAAGG